MNKTLSTIALGSFITLSFVGSAQAATTLLGPGTYMLENIPGQGNQAPPEYGLRLDGLLGGGGSQVVTFDFNNLSSDMKLKITSTGTNTAEVNIFGDAFGGVDEGNTYSGTQSGIANINFTYDVTQDGDRWVAGDGDSAGQSNGSGTINFLGDTYDLVGWSDGNFAFRLGDSYRNSNGNAGWGWIGHTEQGSGNAPQNIKASDWIFQVKNGPDGSPIDAPEPMIILASLLAAGFGLKLELLGDGEQ